MKQLENGTYEATIQSASISESKSGTLSAVFAVTVDAVTLTAYQTLYSEKNGVFTKTIENLKKIFPDLPSDIGQMFDYLVGGNIAGTPVKVVCENEFYEEKEYTKIKYLNSVNDVRGGGLPEAIDKNAMVAKYGSKFRAVLGGTTPPKAAAKPPAKSSPKPPPVAKKPVSTLDAAWELHCKANDGKTEDEINEAWYAIVKDATGKDSGAELTPEDYGAIVAKLDDLPY